MRTIFGFGVSDAVLNAQRAALLGGLILLLPLSASAAQPVVLENNGIRISLGANYRVHGQVTVDGIPFTDQSRLYALRPNAGGRFFGYEDDVRSAQDTKVTTEPDGTLRADYPLRAPRGEFVGQQTFEVTPDRRIRLTVDATLTSDTAGKYEHRIGGIYTGWMAGRAYRAELADGTAVDRKFAREPETEDLERSTAVKDFRFVRIDGPTGPIEITTTSPMPVRLVDYRRNRYFDAQPLWLFGITELPLERGARVQYQVEIKFPPARGTSECTVIPASNRKPEKLDVAYRPAPLADVVVPTPKKLEWGEGAVAVAATPDSIEVVGADTEFLAETARQLADALKAETGVGAPSAAVAGRIRLKLLAGETSAPLEHYRVAVTDVAEVSAETTAGLAAGIQTLRQLVRPSGKLGTVALRRCTIDDYATLSVRGIHFFSGEGAVPTNIKLIQQLMQPLKLNALFYHANNIKWETHTEIKQAGSMKKSDVRKVVEAATRAGITMIPVIGSFGHVEWALDNDTHRHLADNPDNPFAYDPTMPEVYKLFDDIYTEAIELFHPRYVHIGHDEIDMKGFPLKPSLQKIGSTKLFRDDVWRWRNWFAERGIRTIIWGDMFVGPGESPDATLAPSVEEARARRDGLPKDVIIGDWHYVADAAETFKSLAIFNAEGFDTLATTWYHPLNVTNFLRAAAQSNASVSSATTSFRGQSLGIIQSTWTGSKTTEETVQKHPDQLAAFVLAAEASWNGGSQKPDELPYDYREYFAELWNCEKLPKKARPGWRIAFQSPIQLASRFAQQLDVHGHEAHECKERREERFSIETTASLLFFDVAATSGGPNDPPIATSTIAYADGTSETIDWRVGQNVLGVEDHRSAPYAVLLNKGAHPAQFVHRYIHAAKPDRIETITFATANQGVGLIIHGVTGVQ